MGLVYNRSDSGLLVAEHRAEGAAVARSLRQHDPDLRLVPQFSESMGGQYWSVYRYAGSDRPAEFVLAWVEDGRPLPLTSRLLDKVVELDRNSRAPYQDEDQLDAAMLERRDKQTADDIEAIRSDWATREGRSAVLPRSQSLRRARSRTGYHS